MGLGDPAMLPDRPPLALDELDQPVVTVMTPTSKRQ